jgi:uncharacterized protein (TIGR02145 family)
MGIVFYIFNINMFLAKQNGSFIDFRDGKEYKTVKIGTQTWMAENLNYEADGSKFYDNNPGNSAKYGRLYNWATAKIVCPSGWHLPSNEEWEILINFAGGSKVAGKKLKAKSEWREWITSANGKPKSAKVRANSGNGTDEYGFSALPSGSGAEGSEYSFINGTFGGVGLNCHWWSANDINEHDNRYAYSFGLHFQDRSIGWSGDLKSHLLSVRCLQN